MRRKKQNKTPVDMIVGIIILGIFTVLLLNYPVLTFVGGFICLLVVGVVNGLTKNTNIQDMSGYEYEKFVAEKLRKDGFNRVEVTQKSGDFGADIIAVDSNWKKVAIQCKKYSGTVGVKAVQEVLAAMRYYACDYGMVVTNSTFTSAAKEIANKTGVVLKDRYV